METWQTEYLPENTTRIRKFCDSPVLSVSDVELVRDVHEILRKDRLQTKDHFSSPNGEWKARRFSSVWYVKDCLGPTGSRSPTLLFSPNWFWESIQSWDRFRTLSILVDRLTYLALSVQWLSADGPPTVPFQAVALSEFLLEKQGSHHSDVPAWATQLSRTRASAVCRPLSVDDIVDDEGDIDFNHSIEQKQDRSVTNIERATIRPDWNVDGRASCAALWDCTLPPVLGTENCQYHQGAPRGGILPQKELHGPRSERWTQQLRLLKHIAGNNPEQLFIIDVEYQIFNYACPVAFQICVKRYNGEVIISDTVDYEGRTIDELIRLYYTVSPPGFRLHPLHEHR